MDPNEVLTEIRTLASKVPGRVEEVRRGYSALQAEALAGVAMSLASRVWLLDGHLSAGGTPPEEWREGPDAIGTVQDEASAHRNVTFTAGLTCTTCGEPIPDNVQALTTSNAAGELVSARHWPSCNG